jgi:hypothetical protein
MAIRFLQLFIVAMVLQLSWGVANAYCEHEKGKAAQHVGHHQHQHQSSKGAGDTGDDDSTTPKIGDDPDCATCVHLSIGVFTSISTPLFLSTTSHETVPSPPGLPAPFLGAPERPQWVVAA